MRNRSLNSRSSGVVMPIFSLPSPYGIGTLGKEAFDFVDFLDKANQTYWQITPIGHTGIGNSPYQTYSSVAGNPYFIDLDKLVEMKLLSKDYLENFKIDDYSKVHYDKITQTRFEILKEAYKNCSDELRNEINIFKDLNNDWVFDYALFMSLKDYFNQKPVWEWEDSIRRRSPEAIQEYSNLLKDDIDFFIFIQYLFYKQFNELKKYANEKGIYIIGDIPIYPSPDSCDVWVYPYLFKVDDELKTYKVAGVPPDIFSEFGQLWGNPVYDWDEHRKQNFYWWKWRIKKMLEVSDVLRIDHFRGFQDYWEVPSNEKTAVNGTWQPGPRMELFNAIKNELGDVQFIAEDLGIIDDSVRSLLDETGYPGMRVLIYGLRANESNIHLPCNWKPNCVGYTSTHDSETVCESINELLNTEDRNFALNYLNTNQHEPLGLSAVRTVFASSANVVMIMAADLLSLGHEGRINIPSTVGNLNWSWRISPDTLTDNLANILRDFTYTYNRN